jgi:hypothetical protein
MKMKVEKPEALVKKRAGVYLIGTIQKNGIPFPKSVSTIKTFPEAYMNAKKKRSYQAKSENISAFIEGSENQMK